MKGRKGKEKEGKGREREKERGKGKWEREKRKEKRGKGKGEKGKDRELVRIKRRVNIISVSGVSGFTVWERIIFFTVSPSCPGN